MERIVLRERRANEGSIIGNPIKRIVFTIMYQTGNIKTIKVNGKLIGLK